MSGIQSKITSYVKKQEYVTHNQKQNKPENPEMTKMMELRS